MLFIDGSNLFGACRSLSFKIDLEKLIKKLTEEKELLRPYYYCSIPENPSKGTINFINALKYLGFKVITKPLKKRYNNVGKEYYVEKGVDVALVIDILSMANKNAYDIAILVAGDSDYVGAVEEIKNMGKHVEIAFFEKNPNSSSPIISPELRMSADHFISLDEIMDEIRK
jgi:uncharacterized LabA/DUF88 family protein